MATRRQFLKKILLSFGAVCLIPWKNVFDKKPTKDSHIKGKKARYYEKLAG